MTAYEPIYFWLHKVAKIIEVGSFVLVKIFRFMKTYKTIKLYIPEEKFEFAYAVAMTKDGYLGAEEGFDQLLLSFDLSVITEDQINELISEIEDGFGSKIQIEEETVQEKNWNAEWESTIQPIIIDDYFCIYPEWNKPDQVYPVVIKINPKMSFGTGYHETTRLMLKALKQLPIKNSDLLDCGTGTGVLAIASSLLGAKDIFAFDIDEWSYNNSIENFSNNDVSDKIEIKLGGFEVIPKETTYDIILSNVNKNVHHDSLTFYQNHLKKSGWLILSGILKYDEVSINELFTKNGFHHQFTLSENEWISVGFTK